MVSDLKVALVYDRVNKWGGAERVLLALHELFPKAPLYTALYDETKAEWAKVFPGVRTSFLQKLPGAKRRHEWLSVLMPLAFESFDFFGFDVVISVTSEAAKGVITGPDTLHICYCLTPTRYLWSQYHEHRRWHRFGWFNWLTQGLGGAVTFYLRQWDRVAAQRPDVMVAISQEVAGRIRKYYGREAGVVYPPVDIDKFKNPTKGGQAKSKFKIANQRLKLNTGGYFLVVSRLVPYKRADLVINVFNRLKWPLVVVGEGVERRRLMEMAGEMVRFVDGLTDEELAGYYQKTKGLVMAQEEDFGIAAVEAQAAGVPVVALGRGGALETVVEGETGCFFETQTARDLEETLVEFSRLKWNRDAITGRASRFDKKRFKEGFARLISNAKG